MLNRQKTGHTCKLLAHFYEKPRIFTNVMLSKIHHGERANFHSHLFHISAKDL